MAIDKLIKRFLKENGIYGTHESKCILEFVTDFEEAMLPFNAFRWETTEQGHNYWYSKALKWVLYLYDKSEEANKSAAFVETCEELIKYYCLDGENEESLMKIDGYKDIVNLRNRLIDKYQ